MSHKVLQVTVVEGRNLKDKDTFGQDDAYVELYMDKAYKQRTTTMSKIQIHQHGMNHLVCK